MGQTIHGRISNASNVPIYYGVTTNTLVLNSKTNTTELSAKVKGNVGLKGPSASAEVGAKFVTT